jgi:dolichol-phosphate mannosyltransferase
MKTLLFIPTYNERENAPRLCEQLLALSLPIDILFIDDGSPDGTGVVLDEIAATNSSVKVAHRDGKQGIGSAHQFGIKYAYENGYELVLSMDADFTHRPEDIVRLWELRDQAEVVVGSRYSKRDSLPGWNLLRRCLTKAGHALTVLLLRMPYDATGALRLYRIDRIPQAAFQLVESRGYSFFFESLYVLFKNGFQITEIPIVLPARTYGSSKMDIREVKRSVGLLVKTFAQSIISPSKFRIGAPLEKHEINTHFHDPQGWDDYWEVKKTGWSFVYDLVADIYRKLLIRPSLNRFIKSSFDPGARLLHAGCGGGQVDSQLREYADILPLDISVNALNWYRRVNGNCKVLHGSIFDIPLSSGSMDGVYNLGVMEHFTEDEIVSILKEFHRIIKSNGTIVLFWPPEFGLSVSFFKCLGSLLRVFGKKDAKFHPDEITRVRSREHVRGLLEAAGFEMSRYYFGPRDLYTQAMIVGKKLALAKADAEREEVATLAAA